MIKLMLAIMKGKEEGLRRVLSESQAALLQQEVHLLDDVLALLQKARTTYSWNDRLRFMYMYTHSAALLGGCSAGGRCSTKADS